MAAVPHDAVLCALAFTVEFVVTGSSVRAIFCSFMTEG